ncbi:hypothetical protein CYLTODRAFT_450579 [Cylindrobasidium torrendii FP15055 ss-10]|uniref:Phytochrome n=1 Tax=Cylindrobasidium torrendii FP15055 ss-10 TaxID=1314674 RepID=A0A0D7BQ69_9AGAR|nr:hypothetical protein CYLTODRAFT_450579 [Cylindrobasidium torrendii FP15055 ss-10]
MAEQEDSNQSAERPPPSAANEHQQTSYVYPVKSLLTGLQQPTHRSSQSASSASASPSSPEFTRWIADGVERANTGSARDSELPPSPPLPHSRVQRSQSIAEAIPRSKKHHTKGSRAQKSSSNIENSPNYRHFPGEGESPNPSRSFARHPSKSSPSSRQQSPSRGANLSPLSAPEDDLPDFDPRHPAALPLVSQGAFEATSETALVPEYFKPSEPFNPSALGIVHLGPLTAPSSNAASSRHSGSERSRYYTPGSSVAGKGSADGSMPSSEAPTSHESSADAGSNTGPASIVNSSGSGQAAEELVTVRFQAVQEENGYHVVLGREGTLTRCEDEPIRTPGAVQGFGVLIAVDQNEDTLVNSTEILGLSPHYLFSLECFTDVLPEDQAAALWDHIDFLGEPEPDSFNDNDNHPFRLSGWKAPTPDDAPRQTWTCWCAIHRPPMTRPRNSRLVVMEFELERDSANPLYPPMPFATPTTAGSMSVDSENIAVKSNGSSTDESEKTLVEPLPSISATSSVDTIRPDDTTPSASVLDEAPSATLAPATRQGLQGDTEWQPTTLEVMESTIPHSKPLMSLDRLRRLARGAPQADPAAPYPTRGRRGAKTARASAGGGMMDVFAVLAEIDEQLGAAPNLDSFLKIVVGVIKDLTQFHRVLVYQFDEAWNGQVVAEIVDWSQTHDLYKGLHFPAADIPAQARALYRINKVRILYDRDHPTARIVCRTHEDLEEPLNMTHCYLRAMSPIHIKYLGNMGVRASMSVSIMAFNTLWGLVACHTYGDHGMRVSFPVRAMLKLLCQSISRNIERLSYAQRLQTRKFINTIPTDNHPSGYIVSNTDDLLSLFDADFGILVIGDGAKILGPNLYGQEILIMAEYFRLKQFQSIQASQCVTTDYTDLNMTSLSVVAGALYVPLSSGGKDFIVFLRKGQPKRVHWAGRPTKGSDPVLEPRKSFKVWSENVAGRSRAWADEQLDTAAVLALVYGKFIHVWRQKESALQANKLTTLLLNNASHEVRTPLNHIINYLEMALNGPLDTETRDNLSRSHVASKSLLFTINDLLDLTRLESGHETSFNEPFDLPTAIDEAVFTYKLESERRCLGFEVDISSSPRQVVGDAKKIQTVVQNLTGNALKYTTSGTIKVSCQTFDEPAGLRQSDQTAVEIVVADTGCGIPPAMLESIFREFEKVESSQPEKSAEPGVGLGLAVVARIVEQLGGQLRVESTVGEGSRFSFLIPLSLPGANTDKNSASGSSRASSMSSLEQQIRSGSSSANSGQEIESLVKALSASHIPPKVQSADSLSGSPRSGVYAVSDSNVPIRPLKVESFDVEVPAARAQASSSPLSASKVDGVLEASALPHPEPTGERIKKRPPSQNSLNKLRVLIDNHMNAMILGKRLTIDGHTVITTKHGQEALDLVRQDREFDVILMDLNMPILDGYEASREIRLFEESEEAQPPSTRLSRQLHGRIPIFAVSASCEEQQRHRLSDYGMDGWILKPINFKRLAILLSGITSLEQRRADLYHPGCEWESGGWLHDAPERDDSLSWQDQK